MAERTPKTHELVAAQLSDEARTRGRQIYLHGGVRELRADVRRRRYSAVTDDAGESVTVKIEHGKAGPSWICSRDGRDDADCPHVAALLIGIREREATNGEGEAGRAAREDAGERVSLVEHVLGEASREHLIQAFRLCLKTYPELQGDLVFTILENIDTGGELYDEVVALMDDPGASRLFTLPREGFDPYRLLDEINYLYEQERFHQAFLLCRAVIVRLLAKLGEGKELVEHEVDLVISASGTLADLAGPPAPEQLVTQVHTLGIRLLKLYPKLEPQLQSSLIALIDEEILDAADLEELEARLKRRWERARRKGDRSQQAAEAERLAMPLALFYARTRQFDKLQNLFDRYLQNPLLRAPALAEMLQHDLHEVVVEYVMAALEPPPEDTLREDGEDLARCSMYNDLVQMVTEDMDDERQHAELLSRAFLSIGHRMYGVLDGLRELVGDEAYRVRLQSLGAVAVDGAARGVYVDVAKYFVVLCELGRIDEAFALLAEHTAGVDPVILLDYLPNFLPRYAEHLFEAALASVVELLPLVAEPGLRELVRESIGRLWDLDEETVRAALDHHYVDIADDELADYVDALLGDLEPGELGL